MFLSRFDTCSLRSVVLAFAASHDIPVTIKTTGHSLQGQSTGRDTLMIWTRNLPKYGGITEGNYIDSCGSSVDTVATLKIGGGATWSDAYGAVGADYHLVGGNCLTVSAAGGWLQGGGLSSTARKYGIGVDNVLSMNVVLSNGTQVVADPCSEPELFWALRGGGGGTFGVVTSVVYKLHERENIVLLQFPPGAALAPLGSYFSFWGGYGSEMHTAFLDFWIEQAPQLDNRWGGYWTSESLHLYFVGSMADADATFLDTLRAWADANINIAGDYVSVSEDSSYYDLRGGTVEKIKDPGNTIPTGPDAEDSNIGSRLVPKQWLLDNPITMRDLLLDMGYVVGYYLGGNSGHVATDATAMHPAARSAIFSIFSMTDETHALVRATLPNNITGVCYNHHAALEPDWRNASWGDNYDRLLAAKKVYDPENRLNCWHCVGYIGEEIEQGDSLPEDWGRYTASPMGELTADMASKFSISGLAFAMALSSFMLWV